MHTKEDLERHFLPLNEILERLERSTITSQFQSVSSNGNAPLSKENQNQSSIRLSKILQEDYSALNLITMGNTVLHTTALALKCENIASLALEHLQNLAPLVIRIGELLPLVVARELRTVSPQVDLSVAQLALKNTQLIWQKAS